MDVSLGGIENCMRIPLLGEAFYFKESKTVFCKLNENYTSEKGKIFYVDIPEGDEFYKFAKYSNKHGVYLASRISVNWEPSNISIKLEYQTDSLFQEIFMFDCTDYYLAIPNIEEQQIENYFKTQTSVNNRNKINSEDLELKLI